MKQIACKLCNKPFVCDNGTWSTTCTCARDRPQELAAAQKTPPPTDRVSDEQIKSMVQTLNTRQIPYEVRLIIDALAREVQRSRSTAPMVSEELRVHERERMCSFAVKCMTYGRYHGTTTGFDEKAYEFADQYLASAPPPTTSDKDVVFFQDSSASPLQEWWDLNKYEASRKDAYFAGARSEAERQRERIAELQLQNLGLRETLDESDNYKRFCEMEALMDTLTADRDRLAGERDKLQAFKNWVHAYLDQHGVPHHPPGTHGAAGCRIGDRMDWLMEKQDRLAGELEKAREALIEVKRTASQFGGPCWCDTLAGVYCVGQPQCKKAAASLAATEEGK